MQHWICVTCGVQYPASAEPPAGCPICLDDRQYVNPRGQQWTTLDEVRRNYRNIVEDIAPGITTIVSEARPQAAGAGQAGCSGEISRLSVSPRFGIGQRAHLVQTRQGNVLWDCITLLDDETIAGVQRRGGLTALAISHPHYYSTVANWSRAFGDVPVWIHADDGQWVVQPDPAVRLWQGETQELLPGVTIIRCAGHFPGACVLHWAQGAEGRGALFSGDTIQVVADNRWVSFMYSYPNLVPLNAAEIRRVVDAVAPWPFERIYGAFGGIVQADGQGAVRRSAERYIGHIAG